MPNPLLESLTEGFWSRNGLAGGQFRLAAVGFLGRLDVGGAAGVGFVDVDGRDRLLRTRLMGQPENSPGHDRSVGEIEMHGLYFQTTQFFAGFAGGFVPGGNGLRGCDLGQGIGEAVGG